MIEGGYVTKLFDQKVKLLVFVLFCLVTISLLLFFFSKREIDNKEPLHNVMSGWFNGKNVLKVNSFDIAKYIGEQTFWELGGSSRYYFKKILGYLNKF